jgi:hypothetical protein
VNEVLLNKTYRRVLPQDAFFPCRIKARPKQITEGFITLDKFYSILAKRLYVSVKGEGVDANKKMFISLYDKFSGRQIIPKTDIRTFTPNFIGNDNPDYRLEDNDNIHHYFREQAPLAFVIESEQDAQAQVDITVLGERFFTGLNQGSDFTGEIELIENPEQMPSVKDGRIEFKYLPKPLGLIFKATLHNGEFEFNKYGTQEADGLLQRATGEFVGYKLNPMSQYKLSEISIHSNLPQEVFAGAVSVPFEFNLRSTRKQSMMALPFVFNSHLVRSEVESYMQNINADETNFLIGNLYGKLEQTSQIVSLGVNEVRVIVNCVVYEGKEKLKDE